MVGKVTCAVDKYLYTVKVSQTYNGNLTLHNLIPQSRGLVNGRYSNLTKLSPFYTEVGQTDMNIV